MGKAAALATSFVSLLIACALGGAVWAMTGSASLGGGTLVIALNPLWLLVALLIAPQMLGTR